jgi:hypothetical protein
MAASVTGVEAWSNSVATTFAPSGGATGTFAGTTTGTISCPSCCNSGEKYLPGWFSYANPARGLYAGLCPGAVDNSVPVTVYATFSLTPAAGINLADYCIPSSFTIEMIANDPVSPSRLRPLSYATTCPPIYPATRYGFLNLTGKGYFDASVNTGSNPYLTITSVNMCSCNNVGAITFNSYTYSLIYGGSIYGTLGSCSPFSLTFSKVSPFGSLANFYWQSSLLGNWSVTFTL